MKLRLNKLVAGMAVAGSALALVACGGGGAPDIITAVEATVSATNTQAITAATNLTTAIAGTSLNLGTAAAAAMNVPTNSTLVFAAKPAGSAAGVIANATITSGTQSLQTTVSAGSCKFEVTGPADAALRITKPGTNPAAPYALGDVITVTPCAFKTADLTGLSTTPVSKTITITIGNATVETSAEVTKDPVSGVVKFNGTTVATQSSTGSLSF